MTDLDTRTASRLARLRESDVSGVYASDASSEGSDPGGAISVTVDPTLRVKRVQVHHVAPVRTPETLNAAFTAAYVAALGVRYPNDPNPGTEATRPVARRAHFGRTGPTAELLNRHQIRYQVAGEAGERPPRAVVGTSSNGSVSIELSAAGSRGELQADPWWLGQATASRLSAAINEAFDDAYSRRDA